jgi:ABC-type long-subunit fatty acid transport system fused permease/ATPase subunit
MFVSFFPRPFVLTISAVLWGAIAVSFWYMLGSLGNCWDFTFKHLLLSQSEPLSFGQRNSSGSISILS